MKRNLPAKIKTLTESENREIREFVEEVVKNFATQIYLVKLFGSAVRGELKKDSDLDIFIVAKKRTFDLFNKIEDVAGNLFFKHERLISIKLYGLKQYNYLKYLETPFIKNVETEGIVLWKKS
ncbi:MAG: hypothetical protein COS68_02015 [Elusimicrobia bacterium CG06_land_8_20_14_3_00_38_11]|nr:MAG: hypothetical protein COS68_02015 [Elusimicrobia bacterium CG06_land_8_20_14_3_00_38_11]